MVDLPDVASLFCPAEHIFVGFAQREAVAEKGVCLPGGETVCLIQGYGYGSIKIKSGPRLRLRVRSAAAEKHGNGQKNAIETKPVFSFHETSFLFGRFSDIIRPDLYRINSRAAVFLLYGNHPGA